MIDIHSHILFGIDDGSKSITESLNMIKKAKTMGYTDIVCTSHFVIGKYENINYNEHFELLKTKIKEEQLDVNIYKGNEIIVHPDIFTNLHRLHAINDGNYILIELKPLITYQTCVNFAIKLKELEYTPILAHVERYKQLSIEETIALHNMGIIIQMNLRTIANMDKKISYLLKNRYIDVIATDSHDEYKRNYDLNEYLIKLKKIVGHDYFELLTCTNPKKIIYNQNIEKGDWHEKKRISNIFITFWDKLFS